MEQERAAKNYEKKIRRGGLKVVTSREHKGTQGGSGGAGGRGGGEKVGKKRKWLMSYRRGGKRKNKGGGGGKGRRNRGEKRVREKKGCDKNDEHGSEWWQKRGKMLM